MTQESKTYRPTVLTPRTDFPMRANLPEREPERLARWEALGLYNRLQELRQGRPTFILHDGPPYANGDIHLGHALNKTLKDIVVRYKSLKGFRAPFVPGWDCHGLPIEQQVLKEIGPAIHDLPPIEIRRRCHAYAARYLNLQREQFKRLGVLGDWDRPYATFTPDYEVGILSLFRDLVARGLVRKGRRTVHWDPVFRTALAEAEIEYHEHTSDSIYVRFPLRNVERYPSLAGLGPVDLVIWTTTPWTLPANRAVCLHPGLPYVVLAHDGRRSIVAEGLAEAFLKACGLSGRSVARLRASELERAECDHPIFSDRRSLVVLGEHVTLDMGTGCVHTAPGHGREDFAIGQRYGLEIAVPVDERGRFTQAYPAMAGVDVFEANPRIIEELRRRGLLLAAGKIVHEYPYSWRSRRPIIFRATEQWFLELDEGNLRQKALQAIDQAVQWIPPWGRERIRAMVAARPDWCLSRQRAWGVPIPAVRSKRSGTSILDLGILEAFIAGVADRGSDVWFTEPLSAFWPENFVYEPTGESRPEEFDKEFDVLDVWFDSGASHVACLERDPRLAAPADLYLEGSDQHRGWFQSSLLTSIGGRDRPPFRQVLTAGFVLDEQGRAMSKSLGNVISPSDLMERYGADILRLWVASEDYQADMRASEEILQRVAEAYRRIRNGLRFLLGNLHDFDPAACYIDFTQLEEIDRWMLSLLAGLVETVDQAYATYEFHRVYHSIYGFCNAELSTVYLDVIKDRLYCSAPGDPTRRAAQTVLYEALRTLTPLLAPIVPFTSDEVWEYGRLPGQSVHLSQLPDPDRRWRDLPLEAKWGRLLALRDEVSVALEAARRARTIGHSLDALLVLNPRDEAERRFVSENLALLENLLIVSDLRLGEIGGDRDGRLKVLQAEGRKCERCWKMDLRVGEAADHPTLCPRCVDVIRRLEAVTSGPARGR